MAGEALTEEPLGDVGDGELHHGVPLSDPSEVCPLPFRHDYDTILLEECQAPWVMFNKFNTRIFCIKFNKDLTLAPGLEC